MSVFLPVLVIFGFIGAIVALVVVAGNYGFKKAKERADALSELGRQYGMQMMDPFHKKATAFKPSREPLKFAARNEYPAVPLFKIHNCIVSNVVEGKDDRGQRMRIFDAQYTVSTGKSSHTYYYSIATVDTGQHLPELALHHESLWDKMKKWFGKDDLQIGNEQFDKRYRVECNDEAFARSLIMSEMQDRLMVSNYAGQFITGGKVVVMKLGWAQPAEFAQMLDHASFIAERATRPDELSRVRYALEHSSRPLADTPQQDFDEI